MSELIWLPVVFLFGFACRYVVRSNLATCCTRTTQSTLRAGSAALCVFGPWERRDSAFWFRAKINAAALPRLRPPRARTLPAYSQTLGLVWAWGSARCGSRSGRVSVLKHSWPRHSPPAIPRVAEATRAPADPSPPGPLALVRAFQ